MDLGRDKKREELNPTDLFGGKVPVGALSVVERICKRICSSSAFYMCFCGCCVFAFLYFRESINQQGKTRLDLLPKSSLSRAIEW